MLILVREITVSYFSACVYVYLNIEVYYWVLNLISWKAIDHYIPLFSYLLCV